MNKASIHVCVTEASLREQEHDVAEGIVSELHAIEIRPVLDANPDSSPLGRAFLLRQRGQFEAAVGVLTAGLRFAPRDFRLLFNRGYLHYKLARFPKALADFQACWLVCTTPAVATPRAALVTSIGSARGSSVSMSPGDATKAATSAVKRGAADTQGNWRRMASCVAQWNMALCCLRLHDYGGALAHLRIALEPETTFPHEHLKQASSRRPSKTTSRAGGTQTRSSLAGRTSSLRTRRVLQLTSDRQCRWRRGRQRRAGGDRAEPQGIAPAALRPHLAAIPSPELTGSSTHA